MPRLGRAAALAAAAVAIAAAIVVGVLLLRPSEPSTDELIETLLATTDPTERGDAAERLAAPLDAAIAARVAGSALGDANAAAGLRSLTDEYVALYDAARGDAETRTKAVRCLGRIDSERSLNAVTEALIRDPAPEVREAAVTALGQMPRASPGAVGRLVAFRRASGSYAGPRAAQVERALVKIGPASTLPLLSLVPQEPWALRVIGEVGTPAVAPLRKQLRRESFRTRVAASHALLAIQRSHPAAMRPSIPTIVSLMMRKLGTTRGDALWSRDEAAATDALVQVGLAAVDPLVRLARGEEDTTAEAALVTLALMGENDRRQVSPLLAAVRRRDYALITALYRFYIYLGVGERELVGALNRRPFRPGTTSEWSATYELFSSYLRSGNPRLAAGAREWAERHGAGVTTSGEETAVLTVSIGATTYTFTTRTTNGAGGRSWAISRSLLRSFCEDGKRLVTCRRSRIFRERS